MNKPLLPLPEGFALYAEAILNRVHSKLPAPPMPSTEETLLRMRSKGLYIRMDDSSTQTLRRPLNFPHK